MSDLLAEFNEINVQLQGNEINLIKAKSVISKSVSKLVLFKRNLGRRELYRFPSLSGLDKKSRIRADLQVYCDHLSVLHEDMTERFKDLLFMEIPDWVINSFSDIGKVGVLEEELTELQNDFELKPKFKKSYRSFGSRKRSLISILQYGERLRSFLFHSQHHIW
jgi:hypothetical protein